MNNEELKEQIETYKNERETYKRLAETYIMKYNYEKDKNKKAIECINYYAVEDEDYSKIYNNEEQELLNILGWKEEQNE